MNHGKTALTLEQTHELDDLHKNFMVSNCGYFIAENSAHLMKRSFYNEGFLLVYLHKGRAKISFENNKKEIVSDGTVILFKPHSRHTLSYLSDPINERYYVYFEGHDALDYIKRFKLDSQPYYNVGDLSSIIKYFHKIIQDFKLHSLDDELFRTTYLLNILTTISNVVNPVKENDFPETFNRILDTIEKNYFAKLSLASLADNFSISVSTLKRYFKKYMNTSPMDYINDTRINRAKFMLLESDMRVSEISYSVGFEDALYFSKFFKSKTGVSPKNFRKNTHKP